MMETVQVRASRDYPVRIGRGLLDRCGALLAEVTAARRCCVVTDSTVQDLYAGRVMESLRRAGFEAHLFAFPAGEQSKNLATYGEILGFFAASRLTRSDCVVALGGGVAGDMAGFAAATYQRGVDYVQVPTTFLAASDSSVGGKTAVDLPAGKNLCGAFWPPRLVVCDCDTFDTLPPEVFADGAAETLKHGLIADAAFFRRLREENVRGWLEQAVRRNVEIKAAVVAEDEYERGRRKLLNFGHTLGHAIEKCSGYTVPHGHAVAAGMVLITRAAERLGHTPKGVLEEILAANRQYHLPTECPYTPAELYEAAAGDKKRSGDSIDVVVLREIGRAETLRLTMEGLREFTEVAL